MQRRRLSLLIPLMTSKSHVCDLTRALKNERLEQCFDIAISRRARSSMDSLNIMSRFCIDKLQAPVPHRLRFCSAYQCESSASAGSRGGVGLQRPESDVGCSPMTTDSGAVLVRWQWSF